MKLKGASEFSKKNTVFFVVFSIICFLTASCVLPFFSAFGNKPSPDLLLCFCCMLPRFCDMRSCCVYALSLGFLSDLFINTPHLLSPVIYLAATVLTTRLYGRIKRPGTVSAAVCALAALAIRSAWGTVIMLFVRNGTTLGSVLRYVTLPELVLNFAFALAMGFLLGFFTKIFGIQKKSMLY